MSELLTTRELQELLKVDRITIYRMLHEGYLPGFKIGGQWRFARSEIEAWLEAQREFLPDEPSSPSDFAPSAEALPLHCIEAMQGIFAEVIGIATVTCDTDGNPLTTVSNSCAFCDLILSTTEGRKRCERSWKSPDDAPTFPELRQCHAGLVSACAPIRVGGDWIANVVCCQFASQSDAEDRWRAHASSLAAEIGLPAKDLQAAASDVRSLSADSLARIPDLLSRVAETFSEIGQERLALLSRLQRIAEMTKV